jgi:hypothetical protein
MCHDVIGGIKMSKKVKFREYGRWTRGEGRYGGSRVRRMQE